MFRHRRGLKQSVGIAYTVTIENADGGSGDDALQENSVGKTLTGNGGADTLFGGPGGDTFIYSCLGFGHDTIQDFSAGSANGHDILSISRTVAANYTTLTGDMTQVDANSVLTIDGVNMKSLVAADFNFT